MNSEQDDDHFLLSTADLRRLTKRKQKTAQCAALRRMGIRFKENLAGEPVVTRDAVRAFTGDAANDSHRATLNLSALDGPQT